MNFKKIMLIMFILLAVLTIGAVSASDDVDFNETLTADNVDEVSLDASLNENAISEDSDDLIASSDEDILEDSVTEDNFNTGVSTHEPVDADWNPDIVNVHGDDIVQDGKIELTISKEGSIPFTDEKSFGEDSDGNNDIIWSLNDLRNNEVLNEVGTYNISLKYVKDDVEIDFGDFTFILTKLNFHYEGETVLDNPFDIIKIWNDEYDILVYINGSQKEKEGDSTTWSLSDLEIQQAGEYSVRIEAYDEDEELFDEYEYVLNVYDLDESYFAVFSNIYQIYDVANPVILIYRPEGKDGEFKINVNGEEIETQLEFTDNWAELTLDDLGIDQNERYSVSISYVDDENPDGREIFNRDLDVAGFLSEDSFDTRVSTHEPVDADWNPDIVNVHGDDIVQDGKIELTISKEGSIPFTDEKLFGEDSDENNDIIWLLEDLRDNEVLNEVGTYEISLKYIKDDVEIDLGEYEFTLTQFNYNIREGDFYKDCSFEIIRVYDEVYVEVYVNGKDEPYIIEDVSQISWTLDDLDITSVGDYKITIVAYDDGEVVDNFTFNLNVFEELDGFRAYSPFEIQDDSLENPVLYLYSPDGQIGQTISMFIGDDFFEEVTIESNWMSWTLKDLGIEENDGYSIRFENEEGYLCDAWLYVDVFKEFRVDVWDSEECPLYTDTVGTVIHVEYPEGMSGMLDVIVDGTVKYHTIVTSENHLYDDIGGYDWDLKYLGITDAGTYNVTLKFVVDGEQTVKEYLLDVQDFDNNTFRAKVNRYDEPFYLYLFTPEGKTGIVNLTFKYWDDDLKEEVIDSSTTIELDDSYWNKWVMISDYMNADADRVEISIDGEEIYVDYSYVTFGGNEENSFKVTEEKIFADEDIVLWIYADTTDNNYTVNITGGNDSFSVNVTDLGDYEWVNGGYKYSITRQMLDSLFANLNDKDKVLIGYDTGDLKSLAYRGSPMITYAVEKNDDYIRLYEYESLRVDLIKIKLAHNEDEEEAEDEDEFEEDSESGDDQLVRIIVPDSLNIHETALVHIRYGDTEITKNLNELYNEFNYDKLAVYYYILLTDLNTEKLKDKSIVNVSVTSNDDLIGSRNFFMFLDEEENWCIDYFEDSISLTFHYGKVGDLQFGQGEKASTIIELSIPEYLNITDGAVIITDENGNVIFSKSLSEFCENSSQGIQSYDYWIGDEDFNYGIFEQNLPFDVSFAYGNTTKVYARGVREGDELHRITTPENVAEFYKVTLSEGILINGSDNAIIIEATDNANRQSINIDIGGGYFVVYVNGKKVENLGRLVGLDGETELELFLLQRVSGDGSTKVVIYLSDLNITDNGQYNIRVTHQPSSHETSSTVETELFNQNITLTSNVKVDNVTSEVFTGFGMDPVLLYLDTYYGNITDVTGNITVLNSDGEEILFISDISKLSSDNGRYYLKYSDFKNKNFTDKITLIYEGNERSGNTTVNVTWKDVDTSDFNLAVDDDVNDYYGNFVSLQIPDLITTGQIIVTVTFNNNPNANISNMNVSTDYGSKAVYVFNVADIKTNANGELALSLSELGFYEEDGDYIVDVKFTVDKSEYLNVTNNTLAVALSPDVNITIDETSRFTKDMPFAGVKIFEPTSSSNAKLFIDGAEYDHKIFVEGLITFTSSPDWTPGIHTARIEAYDEYGSVVATLTKEFEVLTQSDDTSVTFENPVKEGKHSIITINVANDTSAIIQIDNGEKTTHELTKGVNTIDLGVLTHGNHTVGIFYEVLLGDGNISFYNGYITISVEYESWLDMPYPIVLDDDDIITFNLDDATGNVTVMIDDKLYDTIVLENGAGKVRLTDLKFGKHNFTITYNGDDTHERVSQSGEFEVKFIFRDDIITEGYPLKDSYLVTVILPNDATGNVTLVVDGGQYVPGNDILGAEPASHTAYVYQSEVRDGKAVFEIKRLGFGVHKLKISYNGDAKYPEDSYETLLDINHYAVIGEISDSQKTVSLLLPANATGNLVVYNDNRREILYVQPLNGGRASVDLNNLPVGIYDLQAYYDGDDYEVRQFTPEQFKVLPKVVIAQDEIIGEDVMIFVDLDNATGHLLIVIDGLSPVLEPLSNGTVNYTFKTQDYSFGNHSVTFMYIGNSFDPDVFNTVDETGRYVPVKYYMNLLPIKSVGKVEAKGDYVSFQLYDEDGNPLTNATGTVEVFRDGVLEAVVEVNNGIVNVPMELLKEGEGTFTFVYSGDRKHSSSTTTAKLNIAHKAARITAKDLTLVYSSNSKYSVTVYTPDGALASNTAVSFLINNNAYKTVKTNAKGIATVVITSNPGSYKITAKALGASVTKNLKVNHVLTLKKVKVKRSAKKLQIKATLKKVNGKYLKGKKITLKFNGKKFTAKTNKKGVAKFTIKSKVLKKLKAGKKIKIQATYQKDTVKQSVKVKK